MMNMCIFFLRLTLLFIVVKQTRNEFLYILKRKRKTKNEFERRRMPEK
jgi:hypothetical protein